MATALPGHEVPLERRGSEAQKARYVAECCDEILPALAADGARFVDVFCEHGVFGLEESRRILEAGKACGLLPRLHADELTPLGGARLAAEVGALSADHLLFAQPDGIHAMAKAGVVATLLPGTSVFLRMNRYAPAREMVSAGVAVALGTDCNPGSSYTESLPAVAFFATIGMGLTVEETLTAMTLNAAASVGEAARRGSLEPGKAADVVLVDGPQPRAPRLPLRRQPGDRRRRRGPPRRLATRDAWPPERSARVRRGGATRPAERSRRTPVTDLVSLAVRDFSAALASDAPAPGGGSASAAAGAMGAALLGMVCRLTLGKEKYRDAWEELERIASAMDAGRDTLLGLVDEDTRAYDAIVAARKLPKETPEEKAARKKAIDDATILATTVPMQTAFFSMEAIVKAPVVLEKGNPNCASDAFVAALLLSSAVEGALANVRINLPGIPDAGPRRGLPLRHRPRRGEDGRGDDEGAGAGEGEGADGVGRNAPGAGRGAPRGRQPARRAPPGPPGQSGMRSFCPGLILSGSSRTSLFASKIFM